MDGGQVRVLISAGPTREYLDRIRFLTNASSGLMGYGIAARCAAKGWDVTLVSGPTGLGCPPGVRRVCVESALQMRREMIRRMARADCIVMTAAVSDWRPARRLRGKMKRKSAWCLRLVPNPDILKEIGGRRRPDQLVIGFALETGRVERNAALKMCSKRVDMIVANTPDFIGKGVRSRAAILWASGRVERFEEATKDEIAASLVRRMAAWQRRRQRPGAGQRFGTTSE